MEENKKDNISMQGSYNLEHGNLGKEALQELIFDLTEAPVKDKLSDFGIDREHEKILLLSGKEISPVEIKNNLYKLITDKASEYVKRFPQSFYDEYNTPQKLDSCLNV